MNRAFGPAILALLISGCSLAGDVTPPPALATAQMAEPAVPPTPAPLIPPAAEPDIAAGAVIYAEKCAPCHGPEGLGDGELADGLAFAPAPLGDPDFALQADPSEWYRAVTIGNLDRLMPGFASLTDQQRWDVVGYALSLSDDSLSLDTAADNRPPQVEHPSGTAVGRISNGSAGGVLPANLGVSLFAYDGDNQVVNETATLGSDGRYAFEGLEYAPGRLFFTSVVHDGLTYRSDVVHGASDGSALDLPITIYETTNDLSVLRVERLHLIFDFPAEGILSVLELWVLANDSDRVLTTPLQVALPEGASNLTFENGSLGGRFEITRDGFVDLEPIPPGAGTDHLVFGFNLPISQSTQFDQLMRHPVDAVTVLTPADGPRVTGLQERGLQDFGGLSMQSYEHGSLPAGGRLSFGVSASPTASSPPVAAIVGAGALILAALASARFWIGARRSPQEEDWVEAIARLDDEYEAGELSEEDWRRQREPLKRQALNRMGGSDD